MTLSLIMWSCLSCCWCAKVLLESPRGVPTGYQSWLRCFPTRSSWTWEGNRLCMIKYGVVGILSKDRLRLVRNHACCCVWCEVMQIKKEEREVYDLLPNWPTRTFLLRTRLYPPVTRISHARSTRRVKNGKIGWAAVLKGADECLFISRLFIRANHFTVLSWVGIRVAIQISFFLTRS